MSVALLQERPPYVRFEIGTVEARDENGIPIVKDVAQIHVTPAGSKDGHIAIAEEWIKAKEEAARKNPPQYSPEWANRFRESFKLWSEGQEIPLHGTPVRTWPALSPAEVRRCIESNVLTVEDLAQANDMCLQRLGMGAVALKQRAETWLADKTGTHAATEANALRIKNEDLQRQISGLSDTISRMSEQLANLTTTAPKRGKRAQADDEDVIK